ncbi:MAG: trehalase [Flavobacteriaceae bacterium]|nr:trehalase [Flavobacteriaceae bacterium]
MIVYTTIEETIESLLKQEDTIGNKQITIEDKGPKSFELTDINTGTKIPIKGTYYLSNLLQELILAKEHGRDYIDSDHIFEQPVERLKRMIETHYWDGLTRTIDAKGLEKVLTDDKSESKVQRIYIPHGDHMAWEYFKGSQSKFPSLQIIRLPEHISPEYILSINDEPGILSLKLETNDGKIRGVPFVVPGGRFNEMYGWDSYFEAVGLLLGPKAELAKAMADNFQYEIEYYGKILNANRTYYLTRTQPPFYSSLIREVYENPKTDTDLSWLKRHLETAIKEYETVWMVKGKRLTENGLNRYFAEGIGLPPETEVGHFDVLLKPYADRAGMSVKAYEENYYQRKVENKELDAYFIHDRSVRESGHDTSYRLEDRCAHLNAVELNTFLYKYETDFAHLIWTYFDDSFKTGNSSYDSRYWLDKAGKRKESINEFLWDENDTCYYDFDSVKGVCIPFISATSLLPLWAGIPDKEQAKELVENILPRLTFTGGVAGCTEEARGELSADRPARQWDYPNGWAPHQMMIWKGLLNYGFDKKARELIYRWLWMITKNAVDYNGTIPEKYDVVSASHKVFAEYGNVGTDFEYITREGFGWMNASYIYGLSLLPKKYIDKLNELINPETIFDV